MPRADCKSMTDRGSYSLVAMGESERMAADAEASPMSGGDPYSPLALDNDWYAVLKKNLKPSVGKMRKDLTGEGEGEDTTDFGPQVSPKKRITAMDEIDGRGCFNAAEVEKELREMPREKLHALGLSRNKIREILNRADPGTGEIKYKDFLETMGQYRLSTEQASHVQELIHAFAFAEEFTCAPPKLFMLSITVVELAFFVYLCVHLSTEHGLDITFDGPVPFCSVLIYNPFRRWEAWRYITYMFVHIGIFHFVFNMIMQLLVGVFLEMEQEGWVGSLRVCVVYFAGVAAGSLGTSISDPNTYIAGASGGVYALIAAHLATLMMNWNEDSNVRIKKVIRRPLTRTVRLIFIFLLTAHDIAVAVYVKYFSDGLNRTGFVGHLCGAMAGLLVGIFVLDNRRVQRWEPVFQWISFGLFLLFVTVAIVWNCFANEWFENGYYPPSDFRLYDDESGNCKHYDL